MPTNRYLCTVLDEMRTCVKTLNFAYLLSLIEEVQHLGNRMESKLQDIGDFKQWTEEKDRLWEELKVLRKEKEALTGKKENRFDIFD